MNRTLIAVAVLVMGAGLFAGGLAYLLRLRFESGDVFPPYSTLRTDPLGGKAFFASLENLESIEVERNFLPWAHAGIPEEAVYFLLGSDPGSWRGVPEDVALGLEGWVARGGRLVIASAPIRSGMDLQMGSRGGEAEGESGEEADSFGGLSGKRVFLEERWGFNLRVVPSETFANSPPGPIKVRARAGHDLPAELPWQSALVLSQREESWETIYERGSNAVVMVRALGRGELVLLTDSYLFSNEALFQERFAPFLAWVTGDRTRAVFDEWHLGVSREPGIAMLARRYRLEGFVLSFLLVALLYVWKNGAAFPPRAMRQHGRAGTGIRGKDSTAGFVNLLRRSIPKEQILEACFGEWKAGGVARGSDAVRKLEEMKRVIGAEKLRGNRERDAVAVYRKLSAMARAAHKKENG
jgi:hypothetical protein